MDAITVYTTHVDGVRVGGYGLFAVDGALEITVYLLDGRQIELVGEAVERFLGRLSPAARAALIPVKR